MSFGNQIVLNTLRETPTEQFSPYIDRDADNSAIEILKMALAICSDFKKDFSLRISFGLFMGILGVIFMPIGAGFYAKGKNRSLWFCLLGCFSPIGLIILAVLEDRS